MAETKASARTVSRRAERRQATIAEIKDHARRQLAELGPGGLSLRGIAREMRTASSALYRYFPSQDELINALVVDAYTSLSDALAADAADQSREDAARRMWEVAHAFRRWSLGHRGDFTLIFGTPIPGYEAPEDITAPAAGRALSGWINAYSVAVDTGAADPARTHVGDTVEAGELLRGLIDSSPTESPPRLAVIALSGYLSLLGVLVTEIFGSLNQLVAEPDIFYATQARMVLLSLGFDRSDIPGAG